MRMGLFEVQTALRTIVYKPGWELEAYETDAQGMWLAITATVEDAYDPGHTVALRIKSALPPMDSSDHFREWLRWRLEVIEIHECHEWLRWRATGLPLFNPHAEGSDEPRQA